MRKTWGPPAATTTTTRTLESTLDELRRDGIHDDLIAIVTHIFATAAGGFTVDALMRNMSKDESRRFLGHQGTERGQVYRALLAHVDGRFQCRLCHQGTHPMSWKHPRDVVRHLRRDHFGLGDACPTWSVTLLSLSLALSLNLKRIPTQ
jgi:hypothetical protein